MSSVKFTIYEEPEPELSLSQIRFKMDEITDKLSTYSAEDIETADNPPPLKNSSKPFVYMKISKLKKDYAKLAKLLKTKTKTQTA